MSAAWGGTPVKLESVRKLRVMFYLWTVLGVITVVYLIWVAGLPQ
jgi:hypothetical protein